MDSKTETIVINQDELRSQNIKDILTQVSDALNDRGYNAVNQIAGYLITSDPAYISGHNNARSIIQTVSRHEIIEELVKAYLKK